MKKVVCLILVISMVFGLSVFGFAADNGEKMSKAEFAEYCKSMTEKNRKRSILSQEEIDELVTNYLTKDNYEEYEQLLNDAGTYIYSGGRDEIKTSLRSAPTDVRLLEILTLYNPTDDIWTLMLFGYWDDGFLDDIGLFIPIKGRTKDIGGFDAAGIVLYETSGVTPRLVSSDGSIYDSLDVEKKLYSPANYDTRKGIAFQYQDYITCTRFDFWDNKAYYTYMGDEFIVNMRFDGSFVNFSGRARGFYTHTWSNTTINSIGFNVGKDSFGVDIGFSKDENYFTVYSNADTIF